MPPNGLAVEPPSVSVAAHDPHVRKQCVPKDGQPRHGVEPQQVAEHSDHRVDSQRKRKDRRYVLGWVQRRKDERARKIRQKQMVPTVFRRQLKDDEIDEGFRYGGACDHGEPEHVFARGEKADA